ncbi:hypothetical protein J4444_03470 [Candidatus Woesearchaeota archaeon]|nr:hypothetical protein [Candidatus Woesearchaeota archaeon]
MRNRKNHIEHLEKWALFVRENPTLWKKIHTEFINALIFKNEQLLQRIVQLPNGKEKIIELYHIQNLEGYKWLKP